MAIFTGSPFYRNFSKISWLHNGLWLVVFVCLAITCNGIFLRFIDNMDEASSYQPFYCLFTPHIGWPPHGPCSDFFLLYQDGEPVWSRAYYYVGMLDSVFYLPFYLVWKSLFSARIYSFCWVLILAFAGARLTKTRFWLALFILTLQFHVFYLMVRNSGPNAVLSASVFLAPLFLHHLLKARRTLAVIGWSICTALAFAVPFEIKPFYVYDLPAILLLCVSVLYTHWKSQQWPLKRLLLRCLCPALLAGALAIRLLTLTTREHFPYWGQLLHFNHKLTFINQGALPYWQHLPDILNRYVFNLAGAGFTYYGDMRGKGLELSIGYSALWWLALTAGAILLYRYRAKLQEKLSPVAAFPFLCLLGMVITVALVASNPNSIRPHHVTQAMVLLGGASIWMLGRLYEVNRTAFLAVTAAMALANACTTQLLLAHRIPVPNEPTRWAILDILKRPEIVDNYIIVDLSWGLYYLQTLYGNPDQLISFIHLNPNDPFYYRDSLIELSSAAKLTHRKLLFVGTSYEPIERVASVAPHLHKLFPPPGVNSHWIIWAED